MSATQAALGLPTNTPATMAVRAAVADRQQGRSIEWLELCQINANIERSKQYLRDAALFADDCAEARQLLELAHRRLERDLSRITEAYRRGRWA